jgi:hypothetical protein
MAGWWVRTCVTVYFLCASLNIIQHRMVSCAHLRRTRTMDAQLSRSSIHSTSGFNAERARLGLGAVPSCVVLALRTVLLFLSL